VVWAFSGGKQDARAIPGPSGPEHVPLGDYQTFLLFCRPITADKPTKMAAALPIPIKQQRGDF
jgi:hypothetical protein